MVHFAATWPEKKLEKRVRSLGSKVQFSRDFSSAAANQRFAKMKLHHITSLHFTHTPLDPAINLWRDHKLLLLLLLHKKGWTDGLVCTEMYFVVMSMLHPSSWPGHWVSQLSKHPQPGQGCHSDPSYRWSWHRLSAPAVTTLKLAAPRSPARLATVRFFVFYCVHHTVQQQEPKAVLILKWNKGF